MENTLQVWSQKTKAIFTAVLIYSLGGIVHGIVSGLTAAGNTMGDIMDFAEGTYSAGPSFGDILCYILIAAIVVGYILFILSLGNFRSILNPQDSDAIGKVRTGAILFAVAYVWSLFGIMSWISGVLNILATVFMFIGFSALKKSPTFPALARKGASNLYMAMLLNLIGYICALFFWIPVLGYVFAFAAGVLGIIAFILIILGWSKVKKADPAVL